MKTLCVSSVRTVKATTVKSASGFAKAKGRCRVSSLQDDDDSVFNNTLQSGLFKVVSSFSMRQNIEICIERKY